MCFGRAIWLGRSPSRNAFQCYCSAIAYHCGFAAYRKPPLVNILASDYPIHPTVLCQKRRNSCGIRARYCDALCAAMMTQFLYKPSCSLRLGVAAVGRNFACANCAIWCDDARRLCVQQWFGSGDECERLSSSGAALYCARIRQRWWAQPLPIVVPCGLVAAEPCAWVGARRVAR